MSEAKPVKPVTHTSKTYKGVRIWGVRAKLTGDTIAVTFKLGKMGDATDSPWVIPLAEWPERGVNPAYDQWEYLTTRFNPNWYPRVNLLVSQATSAIREVVEKHRQHVADASQVA